MGVHAMQVACIVKPQAVSARGWQPHIPVGVAIRQQPGFRKANLYVLQTSAWLLPASAVQTAAGLLPAALTRAQCERIGEMVKMGGRKGGTGGWRTGHGEWGPKLGV